SALIELMRSERVMAALRVKWLTLPEAWDDLLYRLVTPRLLGTPLRDLTVRFDTSIVMIGTGGLIGMRTAASLLLGALFSYLVLAPNLIARGIIATANYRAIASWTLWGGAALMTTASLWAFLSRPGIIIQSFTG